MFIKWSVGVEDEEMEQGYEKNGEIEYRPRSLKEV